MQLNQPILIIGGGKMGGALAMRWQQAKLGTVQVVEQDPARRTELQGFGIATFGSLAELTKISAFVILAIKPQQFTAVAEPLQQKLAPGSMLISIMAGVPLAALEQITDRAVRVMPNLPALIGASMSVACAPNFTYADREIVTHLFDAVGKTEWVEKESLLHAVTAISGSGPAYLFAFMEAMHDAAVAQGLDPKLARSLVTQTMLGAASLADRSASDVAMLRRDVTSPGGTTEAALSVLHGKFDTLVTEAVNAAVRRSKELGS